jgi:transposase
MNPSDFAAYIGIDWADEVHAVCLVPADQPDRKEQDRLEQSPEAVDAWVQALRRRFPGGKVALCLEQAKGALIYALMQHGDFVLFPINPKQLARFRDSLHPSGAKDDPSDAELMVELLIKHRQKLRAWQPDNVQTRLLRMLTEDRRNLVDQRTRLTNALKSRLKQYFPLALEVLGELDRELACRFLLRWGTFDELRKENPAEIAGFYRQQHCYRSQLIAERLATIASAQPLTQDGAVMESGQRLVRALAEQLLALLPVIAQYDLRLAELFKHHADAPIFDSLPGAGAALAPRLMVAFGTDRERFSSAQQLQQYSGIAPVTRRSGRQRFVYTRWACPKFLKQTFHEFALHSIRQSSWAAAYYAMQRSRGKGHQAAVRALAFKWIRIIFRCWKARTQYNELTYYQQLVKRKSPLLAFLENS